MHSTQVARLLAYVTGMVNQQLLLQNEYLLAENRILRAHLPSRLEASETPMAHNLPPDKHVRVVSAQLRSGPLTISATDWLHPTRKFSPGNNVAIYLGTHQGFRCEVYLGANRDAVDWYS